jgi:hypothetical protein
MILWRSLAAPSSLRTRLADGGCAGWARFASAFERTSRIALDTNILIYACDREDSRRQQIAIDLVANSPDGVLLWQVACEFVAASRKLS